MVEKYIESFNRCYPGVPVQVQPVKRKRKDGGYDTGFKVSIRGDDGNVFMTGYDILEATKMLNR